MTPASPLGRLVVMTNDTIHSIRTGTTPFVRRGVAALACAAVVVGAGVSALASPAAATPTATGSTSAASAVPEQNSRTAGGAGRTVLDPAARKVVEAGAVGYLAHVRDGRRVHTAKAGLADLRAKRPIGVDDQFEAGSNTKTFTSVVVLQLVAQGRLSLDDPIEKHLPGVIPNGDEITVRQLLNHTSGIFNYTADRPLMDQVENGSPKVWSAMELVRVALQHEPDFAPGTSWNYSNTNYILAGLILEEATGRSAADLIERRITRPLGLRHTYLAESAQVTDHHAHGYFPPSLTGGEGYVDVTELHQSWIWTAGALVSTVDDQRRFWKALLGGRLLRPAQMAELKTLEPAGGVGYGLGIYRYESPCGPLWGHDGKVPGYSTISWHDESGRRGFTLGLPTEPDVQIAPTLRALLDIASCRALGSAVPETADRATGERTTGERATTFARPWGPGPLDPALPLPAASVRDLLAASRSR